jgi:hypothetical protein
MALVRVQYFSSIYKEPGDANLAEIVKVGSFFPCLVTKEYNAELYEYIGLQEILGRLSYFHKGKSLG